MNAKKEEKLERMKAKLATFADVEFSNFIACTMLKLSLHEIHTIQFAFWFCHIVERDLDSALQQAFRNMEAIMGKTSKELVDFIEEKYGVGLEKVDPSNPKYNPECITFNDRIDIVEKIMGKSDHTRFLRKVKKLRNDVSHGRIHDLTYEGKNLLDNEVKRQLMFDYIKQALNVEDMKSEGGILNQLTEEEKRKVDEKYEEWLQKNKK